MTNQKKKVRRHTLNNGDRFGRLMVVGKGPTHGRRQLWRCMCECGGDVCVEATGLINGVTRSCGCLRREVSAKRAAERNRKHDLSTHPIYGLRQNMIRRCTDPQDKDYPTYGGRGISVCERWLSSVEAFLEDMGPRPPGMSLDRIDNNGNYEPGNCRWATSAEQARNTRSTKWLEHAGQVLPVVAWAEITGLPVDTLYGRLKRGWDAGRALTTPSRTCAASKEPNHE